MYYRRISEYAGTTGGLGRKVVVLSHYVCGGFCRRTRSPHFFAALSNSRMHSFNEENERMSAEKGYVSINIRIGIGIGPTET